MKITINRATVEQALEAICSAKLCEFNSMSSRREMVRLMDEAITALRAALAQQAEPTWVCPDSPEHRYAKPGHCEDCGKTLVQEQGCDHCNHPLYAATKCRVCGRVTEQAEPVATHRIDSWGFCGVCRHDRIPGEGCARQECPDSPQQAEPVQEPVAWRYKYSDGFWRFSNGSRVNGCDPIESQALYTALPQRKPLTEEEIAAEWQKASECASKSEGAVTTSQFVQMFARAIERALEEKNRGR